MGTQLLCNQIYLATPTRVLAMVCNADYITGRAKATGALTVTQSQTEGSDGSIDLVIERTLPADMPSYARSIVGETLTITEHQVWQPADDTSCAGRFEVKFSAPLVFKGTVQMRFDGNSTTVVTSGEIKASVPFVGGKVERLALAQTERYLHKEQEFANNWLVNNAETA